MLLIKSLIFNIVLYLGIVFIFLIAIPALILPSKIVLLFGKFLGYYVVFIVRIFLSTTVEFKGTENIPKSEKYFIEWDSTYILKEKVLILLTSLGEFVEYKLSSHIKRLGDLIRLAKLKISK